VASDRSTVNAELVGKFGKCQAALIARDEFVYVDVRQAVLAARTARV
jgi:hypothetical protein